MPVTIKKDKDEKLLTVLEQDIDPGIYTVGYGGAICLHGREPVVPGTFEMKILRVTERGLYCELPQGTQVWLPRKLFLPLGPQHLRIETWGHQYLAPACWKAVRIAFGVTD